MNFIYLDIFLTLAGLTLSYLILMEFKTANAKQPCKFNEKLLKDLIAKIDKVIVTDKVENKIDS